MTPEQRRKINILWNKVTFLPGAYDKRFVGDLYSKPDDYELSDKQAAFLEKTFWRYRRQHGEDALKF